MATHDDDEGGPSTRPTRLAPAIDEGLDRSMAELVMVMRSVADEIHELRNTWKKTGLTPPARAAWGAALRRMRTQIALAERVPPPPPRRPNERRRARRRRA